MAKSFLKRNEGKEKESVKDVLRKQVGIRLNNPAEAELAQRVREKAKANYSDLSKITKEFWRKYDRQNTQR